MYGKGRVFLSVAHPERSYIPATWKFVRLAAEWCLGRSDPENNKAPLIKENIPDSGETNEELTFSAAGSDDPEGYPIGFIWDFGDGSDLKFKPVEKHIYTSPGTFKLTLTVTDGKDESNFAQTITIKVPQFDQ
jgi:PKD repeat protein